MSQDKLMPTEEMIVAGVAELPAETVVKFRDYAPGIVVRIYRAMQAARPTTDVSTASQAMTDTLVERLSEEQRNGLLRARLMVSGDVRLPWGPEPFNSLSALGLARHGGYLTPLGLEVRAALRTGKALRDTLEEGQ
jgi:hypothetical protein